MTTPITDLAPEQRADLDIRSRVVDVVYHNHPMPRGASAARACVGVGPYRAGRALYVDRGITYAGSDEGIGLWLRDGVRYFETFDELWEWAEMAFRHIAAAESVGGRPAARNPKTITNLNDVEAPVDGHIAVTEIDLRSALLNQISGQEPAISKVAAGVARHVSKRFPRKPYSAIFMGNTGVGKTATARLLAEVLTDLSGADWQFVCLDMAEFSERFSVTRLQGAPPGYVGHGDGNDLASRLATNSRTVVLFDEFEKASPVVWQSVLGLLDSGRLASERHGMVTAEKAVLIFTTNVGADIDIERPSNETAARAALQYHGFAPELVGRFGNVITFGDLTNGAMGEIAARSVGLVAADFGVEIKWIAPAYLTNLLQRLVGNHFGVRMAEYLVEADLGEQLGTWPHAEARVEFEGVPVLAHAEGPQSQDGAK